MNMKIKYVYEKGRSISETLYMRMYIRNVDMPKLSLYIRKVNISKL